MTCKYVGILTAEQIMQLKILSETTASRTVICRCIAIIQVSKGVDLSIIADSMGVEVATIYNWIKAYLTEGEKGVCSTAGGAYRVLMSDQELSFFIDWLDTNTLHTVADICKAAEDLLKVKFSITGMISFIKKKLF